MESAQLPGPQPNAQKELMLRLLLSFIHSTNFTHKRLLQGLQSWDGKGMEGLAPGSGAQKRG